jgi:orotate phosphoribosyltransferase
MEPYREECMDAPKPIVREGMSPADVLFACGGFYECPRDSEGKRMGPLVGYAGTYYDAQEQKKQYVGDVYADFAALEAWPSILERFVVAPLAQRVYDRLGSGTFAFCGLPEGGRTLASHLASALAGRYIFPEKVTTKLATETSRALSELRFARHQPLMAEEVIIIEDVCNNFSTTEASIAEVESYGARVVGIVCFLNRSTEHRDWFQGESSYPVIALWDEAMPQWRQEDPVVFADIERLGVRWKPKESRIELQSLMRAA